MFPALQFMNLYLVSLISFKEPLFNSKANEASSIAGLRFFQQSRSVRLNGAIAQKELIRNFLGGKFLTDQIEHLLFSFHQLVFVHRIRTLGLDFFQSLDQSIRNHIAQIPVRIIDFPNGGKC